MHQTDLSHQKDFGGNSTGYKPNVHDYPRLNSSQNFAVHLDEVVEKLETTAPWACLSGVESSSRDEDVRLWG